MSNPLTGKIKLSTYSELVGDAGDEIIDVPLLRLWVWSEKKVLTLAISTKMQKRTR